MKYTFEAENLNPVELEKQLGLNRGDIKEITMYPEGAVEIESIELNSPRLSKLKDILRTHNLPRGKKPINLEI